MEEGFLYSYYEEDGTTVAIVHENTPPETIERLKKIYDDVRYKE